MIMIESYFANATQSMTKDAYFEMCEMLGSEPIESEIPIEIEDFHPTIQSIFNFYFMLRDNWDSMGGGYLGKDTSTLFNLFELYDLESYEKVFTIDIIRYIDSARSKIISEKLKSEKPTAK